MSHSEAEKAAQVSKIQYDQKIMEKESLKKMSEIEGESFASNILPCLLLFLCVCISLIHQGWIVQSPIKLTHARLARLLT